MSKKDSRKRKKHSRKRTQKKRHMKETESGVSPIARTNRNATALASPSILKTFLRSLRLFAAIPDFVFPLWLCVRFLGLWLRLRRAVFFCGNSLLAGMLSLRTA
jgi:hypothetical protein